MTDGDGAEIEPGTTQPVPPSFDGTSPTSDGDEVSAAEHQNKDERDLFGGNRPDDDSSPRQMEGEVDMQAEHMVFPGQPDVNSPDNLHHGASAPRMGLNFRGNHLSENETKILDSTVMISSPGTAPTGVRFQDGHMDLNLRQIRVLCGSRSPNTVAKRATSLMKYCMWHRGFFYKRNPLPLDSEEAQSTFGRNTKTGWPTAP